MTLTCQTLVEAHLDALQAYARAWTQDADLAGEVVQRTFLKAFEKLNQLKEPKAARSWLITILRHEIGLERRAHHRFEVWDPEDFDAIPQAAEEEALLDPALLSGLPAAMGQLPEASHRILLLRYQQNLSYEAIGAHLDVPIGTVMSRLYRAKAALKAVLLDAQTPSHRSKA